MTTGTPGDGIWTLEAYVAHNEALRRANELFQGERDRRYAEVDVEREKALKIKETADLTALGLARDIQVYKDEKANELRSQIERERREMVTQSDLKSFEEKYEAAHKPLADFMASQMGRSEGIRLSAGALTGIIVTLTAIIGSIVVVADMLTK